MKTIFFLLISIVLVVDQVRDDNRPQEIECFVELDQELLNLWPTMQVKDEYDLSIVQKKIKDLWCDHFVYHFKDENLVYVSSQVDVIIQLNLNDRQLITISAWNLLRANQELRNSHHITDYPLDPLFDFFMYHQETKSTISDPLFGLREWGEFVKNIDDMTSEFESYQCIVENQIALYFPLMDIQTHNMIVSDLGQCIEDLYASLDSGYTDDFIMPCDMIETKYAELLRLYSSICQSQELPGL